MRSNMNEPRAIIIGSCITAIAAVIAAIIAGMFALQISSEREQTLATSTVLTQLVTESVATQSVQEEPTIVSLIDETSTNTPIITNATVPPSTNQPLLTPTFTLVPTLPNSSIDFGCESDDIVPELGGSNPPIGTTICIPSWAFGWISTDKANFEIPDVYFNEFPVGFTISLFGPVRFVLSEVESENVRLDVRDLADTSLLGNSDNKSINLVYKDGKVCSFSDYTGFECP